MFHWLPIRQRIQYKLLMLVYRCLHQLAAAYLASLITPYVPPGALRSADCSVLTSQRYRLERYGRRCFSVTGPALWNALPAAVKQANSLPPFKTALKLHLFHQAFTLRAEQWLSLLFKVTLLHEKVNFHLCLFDLQDFLHRLLGM